MPIRKCFAHELQQLHSLKDPHHANAARAAFENAKQRTAMRQEDDSTLYRIPVVVHVIYNTVEENLPDDVIRAQINKLNEDYRRQNADTTNTRDIFLPVATDTRIEFYLATQDPAGNPTNGIVRTQTDRTDFSLIGSIFEDLGITQEQLACLIDALSSGTMPDITVLLGCGLTIDQLLALADIFTGTTGPGMDEMKFDATGGDDAWDTQRYLNIWVCDLNGDAAALGLILGFAYPPEGAPNWPAGSTGTPETDGVVIHYQAIGPNNPESEPIAPFADEGRSCVHEVGHYLGLRHIWGDADCTEDDGLADTPDADAATDAVSGCNWQKNTCTEAAAPQLPDMIENYMDYSSDDCQNLFTQQQKGIMRAMLEGPRNGLLALAGPPPIADFFASETNVLVGQEIQFSDLSQNATNWIWTFGDGNSALVAAPTHTYQTAGTYTVTLAVQNQYGSDLETKTDYITVGTVGVETVQTTALFTVEPNPSKGLVQVRFSKPMNNAQVEVFDAAGVRVSKNNAQTYGATLDLSGKASGVYVVKVTSDMQTQMLKVILQ